MPSVTYNGQSFAIDNRRFWIMGASVQYARVPASQWAGVIAAARQAGFNTIETACPWSVHEPRRDRFSLKGAHNVREFITLCGKAGMKVMLRPGPFVGGTFDGGGLPAWLTHMPGIALRQDNETFLERVNVYFRKLLSELEDLQVTRGGPILLVQSEHAWLCSNKEQAERYLREVTRVIRESGFNVPIINANDFWQDSPGTIDTWRGSDDLLGHLRQLRTVQPNAPRVLSALDAADTPLWGQAVQSDANAAGRLARSLAQCLAAGAQAVISPFHGGTNYGFLGGRLAGGPDRFVTTSASAGAMLGEAGARGARYTAVKRIASFASNFGSLFADLETDFHPAVLDVPGEPATAARKRKADAAASDGTSVISLRGSQGRAIFVFSDTPSKSVNLLLENGVRMPVHLGEQRMAWFVLDADINGSGRIDYANLCPYAIAGKSTVVFFGIEGTDAFLSINGTPVQGKVPGGDKPLVLEHKGTIIVICNERQIDATYVHKDRVFVGVNGLDEAADGSVTPISHGQFTAAWSVSDDGELNKLGKDQIATALPTRKRAIALADWEVSDTSLYTSGQSPRFASLDGPQTLTECGAQTGYGWYSVRLRSNAGRKRLCHFPQAADRAHLWLDGQRQCVVGVGPGAKDAPVELKLSKSDHVLTALLDNLGRFCEGNDLDEYKGLFGHVYEVKALKSAKPKQIQADPVNPFKFRGYIAMRSKGQLSDMAQVCWSFNHAKKSPIIVDIQNVQATGTLLLNDEPLAYYTGATGGCMMRIVIGRDTHESFKRGKNTLRFAPDARQNGAIEQISRGLSLYEAVDTITEGATWSFAKWEPPIATAFEQITRNAMKNLRGTPCWWRSSFETPRGTNVPPLWFDSTGLSKGQAFVNGQNLGRYFTATDTGKGVGPQTRLHIPAQWLMSEGRNELLVFDEHGFDPHKARLVLNVAGDLDE